jgi:drug/metabolite transporter (DMT)-like permease
MGSEALSLAGPAAAAADVGERPAGLVGGVACSVGTASFAALYVTLDRFVMDRGFGPYPVGFLCCATCSTLFLARILAQGRGGELRAACRASGWRLLLIGLLGAGIQTSVVTGVALAGPVSFAILSRTDVLFTLVLSWVLLRERLGAWDGVAIGVMVAGSWRTLGVSPAELVAAGPALMGDGLCIVSALGVAVNAFLIKGAMHRVRLDIVAGLNTGMMALACLLASAAGGTAGELAAMPAALLWVMLLAGAAQHLHFNVYYKALSSLPVWLVRVFTLSTPVMACLLSLVLLARPPRAAELQGMALVAAGAAVAIWQLHARARSEGAALGGEPE